MVLNANPNEWDDPPPDTARLWRYMDLAKYLHMLSSESLWFPRVDQLGDPFEGSSTQKSKEYSKQLYETKYEASHPNIASFLLKMETDLTIYKKYHSYVSSWHLSEYESAAMWPLYSKEFGIAILSSSSQLEKNLDFSRFPPYGISPAIQKVKYLNYDEESIPPSHPFAVLLHKRKSFEHEREVRILLVHGLEDDVPLDNFPSILELSDRTPKGFLIPAKLKELISEVRVDPAAPQWFVDSVKAITLKLDYEFAVFQSDLNRDPIY